MRGTKFTRRKFFTLVLVLLGYLLVNAIAVVFPRSAAVDAVNEFTRMKLRESGFFRRIMPPTPLANIELDYIVPFRVRRPNESADAYTARLRSMFYRRKAA